MAEICDMTNEDLLDELEETVRWWHYSPDVFIPCPPHTTEDLRKEILERMK